MNNRRRGWHLDREGVMLLVMAGVMLVVGFVMVQDLYLLQHRGEVVSGTVLDQTWGKNEHITVRYTTRAGQQVTGETSNYYEAKVGQTIQVVYDPKEPTRMQAADYGYDYWLPAGIFGAVALLFACLGIGQLRS